MKTKLEQQIKKLGILNWLDLSKITNLYPIEKKPKEIENGKLTLSESSIKAAKELEKQGRRPLTVEEFLGQFETQKELVMALKDHSVLCGGSRYRSDGKVPFVFLNDDRPKLDWDYAGNSNARWGSASCQVSGGSDVKIRSLENKKLRKVRDGLVKLNQSVADLIAEIND